MAKPATMAQVEVREVTAVLPMHDQVDMVQHHVSRTEIRRYIALTDQQWWLLVQWVREREAERAAGAG